MNRKMLAKMAGLTVAAGVFVMTAGGQTQETKPGGATVAVSQIPSSRQGPDFNVPYYTGKVYPTPQSAEYRDEFLPLDKTGLLLGKDIAPDDARVALLIERIRRLGGAADIVKAPKDPCNTLILIGETGINEDLIKDKSVPDRAEGYLLHCAQKDGKPIVFLKGKDFHGLLWAITAFNQLVKVENGRPVARGATILDYPDAPGKRGYTAMSDDNNATAAWFGVNVLRANVVQYRQLRMLYRQLPLSLLATCNWRTALRDDKTYQGWQARIRKIGAFLKPLRIEWYDGMQPISSILKDNIRSKSDEDFELVTKAGMDLAEAGGHLMILYDDVRFPISQDDVRDFGTARAADVYFLNKVYAAVAAKYPNFKILFCPPFYPGPASDPSPAYGESRDEYLAAIGKLPKAIEIFWSGPRVKSTKVTPEDTRWSTNLIQRKPVYWQNAIGVYHSSVYYAYPPEAMTIWKDWYYDGFFNDLAFYTYNGDDPYITLTLHDAMWNRKAYDPAASGIEAAKKLVGADAYPTLVEAFKELETMDDYGWMTPTAWAAKNVEEVRRKTDHLVKLFETAPAPVKSRWISLSLYVGYREKYLQKLLKNPDLKEMTELDERIKALAAKEAGVDPKQGCVILTPNDFKAGRTPAYYNWQSAERRYVLWINGARSKARAMDAVFQLPYALAGHSELIIAGLDHNAKPACRIRVLMNGNVVFEGPNPFAPDKWTTHSFPVKGAFLRDGVPNTLRIENLEDSDVMTGTPWFMLSYAVLRPAK
ncbi:MAG: beta-N-acetylglucosaminidase domain-containing protein [Kiritimatiellae bacterium]|nr:beta-N-acetylglucosaminidase domain-containing protein [Kiritimatiellia bacterium]